MAKPEWNGILRVIKDKILWKSVDEDILLPYRTESIDMAYFFTEISKLWLIQHTTKTGLLEILGALELAKQRVSDREFLNQMGRKKNGS